MSKTIIGLLGAAVTLLAILVVVAVSQIESDPVPTVRTWDAYFTCLEQTDTTDPGKADRECSVHRP